MLRPYEKKKLSACWKYLICLIIIENKTTVLLLYKRAWFQNIFLWVLNFIWKKYLNLEYPELMWRKITCQKLCLRITSTYLIIHELRPLIHFYLKIYIPVVSQSCLCPITKNNRWNIFTQFSLLWKAFLIPFSVFKSTQSQTTFLINSHHSSVKLLNGKAHARFSFLRRVVQVLTYSPESCFTDGKSSTDHKNRFPKFHDSELSCISSVNSQNFRKYNR